MSKKTFAIILSGCGNKDGSELQESTFTFLAVHRRGCEYRCFAPDIKQHHVLNYITGEEMPEERSVLIEAARLARGDIKPLSAFSAADFDGLILPGGFGAAKNLCTYAFDGPNCKVNPEVEKAVRDTHAAGKPIGALCIAPVIVAKVLGNGVILTSGNDPGTTAHLEAMGAKHQPTGHGEIAVDRANKIVSTPCYMLDSRVDQVAQGIDRLVAALLAMM